MRMRSLFGLFLVLTAPAFAGNLVNGAGSANPSCSAGQIPYYSSTGTLFACLNPGSNLAITSGVLNLTYPAAPYSASHTLAAADMGAESDLTGTTPGQSITLPAPATGLMQNNQTFYINNVSSQPWTITNSSGLTVPTSAPALLSSIPSGAAYTCSINTNLFCTAFSQGMSLTTTGQAFSGGITDTPYAIGATSGAISIDCANNPYQTLTNNGAITLSAVAHSGGCVVLVANGASAGAYTYSGFSVGSNTGDAVTATNGSKFLLVIDVIGTTSTYAWKALQ